MCNKDLNFLHITVHVVLRKQLDLLVILKTEEIFPYEIVSSYTGKAGDTTPYVMGYINKGR